MVQEYVRRGKLEALIEGQGVSKTYHVSIDSLSSLREQRGNEVNDAPSHDGGSSRADRTANSNEESGAIVCEVLRETIERLETRAAEAAELKVRLELTAQAESSLREALECERERADRLETELREVRNVSPGLPGSPEMGSEIAANKDATPREAQGTLRRRSWLYRFFFGP